MVVIRNIVKMAVLILVCAGDIDHDMMIILTSKAIDMLPNYVDGRNVIKLCIDSAELFFRLVWLRENFHDIRGC